MTESSIRKKCTINTNKDEDTFVGIICKDGDISIHFPLGFRLSEDDKELRNEVLLLLNTIRSTTAREESEVSGLAKKAEKVIFPIQAYLYIIYDFLSRGYYKEREMQYDNDKKGKINWNKTIKTKEPCIYKGKLFYLDFVVKKNTIKQDELISLIHEYLVYDSFEKIGWLFTGKRVKKPAIKYNEKMFRLVLKDKIGTTFNDTNKKLFINMLNIIDYIGDNDAESNYKYGTYRFEYVWEQLIDRVFGITGKEYYFPKTTWIVNGIKNNNASLEPDTIMLYKNDIYVLDAKYYKYGTTGRVGDLPESTSINKQITYGEYIAEQEKFKKKHGTDYIVYNAFLMPYDKGMNDDIIKIGEAVSDWKDNYKKYERVQGILVDVKFLMQKCIPQDEKLIEKLAKVIMEENYE